MARFIQPSLSCPLNDALYETLWSGWLSFRAQRVTGWRDSCFNNACIPLGSTGGLTSASGAGGSDTDFSPPSVKLLELSWERKVIPSHPAQPTAHDSQPWKMHLAGVTGGTVSFPAVRAVTTRDVSLHPLGKGENWPLLCGCLSHWGLHNQPVAALLGSHLWWKTWS